MTFPLNLAGRRKTLEVHFPLWKRGSKGDLPSSKSFSISLYAREKEDQPWRFVVWNKETDAAGWQRAFDCLAPGNQGWVKDAPLLMLTAADSLFYHNDQPNRWGQHDTGAAAENLCLQAEALGLMAHQMGGFDPEKARAVAGVPEQFTLMAMIAVGYPADPASFSPEVRERETAPRRRRELGELFFEGTWANPVA